MGSIRDAALNAQDIPTEQVEVPEWGVTIEVRGMTGRAQARYMEAAIDPDTGSANFERIYPELVIATAYDPASGEPVFEAADRDVLLGKSAKALERIAQVGLRLSGMGPEAQAEAAGN